MTKLFRYELHRFLFNKFFLGLLVITGLYSYQILSGDIIRGVANTAPFSKWSYGAFLSSLLPLNLITLLFFISFLYSKKEQRVQVLTGATPIERVSFALVRYAAIVTAFALICCVVVLISIVFYQRIFHFGSFGNFLSPILLTLSPAMLFVLGVGLLAGRVQPGLIYVLMLLLLVLNWVSLPYGMELFGGDFYQNYPSTLQVGANGEPAFIIPTVVWIGKAAYVGMGILFLLISLYLPKKACQVDR
ncbi:hypothetical protein [Paenibacillus donghaensis]|uniref:ABC transporter permease n=1 Tax=Paenibacillus donghaensis TaxID=414771 RepID=A0A2Z2KPL7_9BACL|nr:hypothetical protein [Paenibacillus donghaensis]ASA25690.1 hypothetical protein B9T62_36150 [Paenibacillus donghaensis]